MTAPLSPLTLLLGLAVAGGAVAAPAYELEKTIPLGAPDRWDYVVADPAADRVYVAHGDRVAVVDEAAGAAAGEVDGIPGGTHGVAISHSSGRGYTDDGKGQVVGFDLKTFAVTSRTPVAEDADAMTIDPVTGKVFVMHGDPRKVSVIAPRTGKLLKVVDAGEKLEYAAADGAGSVFIAGVEKSDVLKLDTKTNAITARWPISDCARPHGVAVDPAAHRVFVGCVNSQMMVVDTRDGRIVARLPIGKGSDAVAYDPQRKRVFSSNGADGTISVYQQTSPDAYQALDPVKSGVTGRTMSVDPKTGRLFVAALDVDPPATPGGAMQRKPGTFHLLVFKPVE